MVEFHCIADIVGVGQSPGDRPDSMAPAVDVTDMPSSVSQREIDTLKQAAVAVCSDSLFKKIQEINRVTLLYNLLARLSQQKCYMQTA